MKINKLTWLLLATLWVTAAILMLITSSSIAGELPTGYSSWANGRSVLGGMGPQNYQKDDGSWAEIDNSFVVTSDSAYCHTAILRTTIYPDGATRITLKDGENYYSVLQELVGIGWINKSTWAHQWIDQSMTFGTPTVDSNSLLWAGISPGVDFSVTKVRTGVQHKIQFKPGFLDSMATLYDQRSDSLNLGLANVFKYSFTGITGGDSAVGDVTGRQFKKIGNRFFGLSHQHLFYPGWDDTANGELINPLVDVRQYWKRVGASLYCLEWVPMRRVKQAHLAYPDSVLWHNLVDTLGTDTSEFRDNFLDASNTTAFYGTHASFITGYTGGSGMRNEYIWGNFPAYGTDTSVAAAFLWMNFTNIKDSDTLELFPVDPTVSADSVAPNTVQDMMSWAFVKDSAGFPADVTWATAGGDWGREIGQEYQPTTSAGGWTGWHRIPIDRTWVDSVTHGTLDNWGMFLITTDRTSTSDRDHRGHSIESTTANLRPYFETYYNHDPLENILIVDTLLHIDTASNGDQSWERGSTSYDSLYCVTNEVDTRYLVNAYDSDLDSNGGAAMVVWSMTSPTTTFTTVDSVMVTHRGSRTFGTSSTNRWRVGLIVGSDTSWQSPVSSTSVLETRARSNSAPGSRGAWTNSSLDSLEIVFQTYGDAAWSATLEVQYLYQIEVIVKGDTASVGGEAPSVRRRKLILGQKEPENEPDYIMGGSLWLSRKSCSIPY